ncbi:hypothetical protein BH24ACI4_BH24ACI4_21650 [soil metagenome]
MVEKFFGALGASCRRVDPNRLNLGIRYHTIPPEWAVSGMRSFEVFSMNCNRLYEPLCRAARASHERMYDVATGRVQAYDDAPEYLPRLFL